MTVQNTRPEACRRVDETAASVDHVPRCREVEARVVN
jgi:hypothetical protein